MLKPVKRVKGRLPGAKGKQFAIVASRYNARYVDAMLRAAQAELRKAGVNDIQVIRVPGAYEIPVVVSRLVGGTFRTTPPMPQVPQVSAIICLGVILRGETIHAAHIGEAVSRALMEIQVRSGIPVIHEVLLLENEAQARARCLGQKHNRGTEAAQTALAMAKVMMDLG
jgi:6,7-dimethyl-8-ribityllumazine synthase